MSPGPTKTRKILITVCIWILVLLLTFNVINDDKKTSYYKFKFYGGYLDAASNRARIQGEEKFHIDRNLKEPSALENLDKIQQELPNIPFDFWIRYYQQPIIQNDRCTNYPYLLQLNFHNIYWQTFQNGNVTFQLYGAYYDKRVSLHKTPLVRLLAMINQKDNFDFPKTLCQLWFDNRTVPTHLPLVDYHRIYPNYWNLTASSYYPYLLTCSPLIDSEDDIPRTISLTIQPCFKTKNNLRIHFEEPTLKQPKKHFAVCVKGLNFPYTDNSARLIEWLELLRILGASKIFLYKYATHANVSKVLTYYQKTGFVDVTPLTLAGGEPNLPNFQFAALSTDQMVKRLNEYIPYNDCQYRHMYKYDYIAAIDIDEIIMPIGGLRNWTQILERAQQTNLSYGSACIYGYAAVCFLNVYFPEFEESSSFRNEDMEIPSYMYMLGHTARLAQYSDVNTATKCFHNTSQVHTLHNHFPLTWLKSCAPIIIDKDIAQLQHYRKVENDNWNATSTASWEELIEKLVVDKSILRFKNDLIIKSQQVLRELGFLEG